PCLGAAPGDRGGAGGARGRSRASGLPPRGAAPAVPRPPRGGGALRARGAPRSPVRGGLEQPGRRPGRARPLCGGHGGLCPRAAPGAARDRRLRQCAPRRRRAGRAAGGAGPLPARAELTVDPASRSRWVGAIVPFLPALSPEFVNWDDPGALLDNLHYRGLGPRQLVWMFTTFHMGHYMPLTWLSLGWDYVMWEMSAWGYHLDNLLLHAAAALIFYFLARRLLHAALERPSSALPRPLPPGGDEQGETVIRLRLAAAAAALFCAVHPLRAESVAWITERRDVLSGLFYLAAALAYVKAVSEEPRR